jgi:DNA repair protein RecO (recombination protein O)
MALLADRCICLRKVEYSETSQILMLFARAHGLVRVIAKGAHRVTKAGASRFGGGLDLMDVGEGVFTDHTDRDLATLTEWKLVEGHPPLRRTLRGLMLGFYAIELTGLLIEEHDPHPQLFDRLEATLLELGTPRREEAFLAFELDLLRETGYWPRFGECVSCGRPVEAGMVTAFEPTRGGVLCRNCEPAFGGRMGFDGRLLGVMRQMLRADNGRRLPKLTRHQTDPINRLLAGHVEHTLSKRLRMVKWIQK